MTMRKLMPKLISAFLVCLGLVGSAVAGAQSIDPTKQINWTLGPIPQMQPAFINGIPQVASWTGSDACAKLHNAMLYAINNSLPLVDATGLNGVQPCASNPFLHLNDTPNAPVNLTVNFGATTFQTTVPWVVTNSTLQLRGLGAFSTRVDYTGAIGAAAVMTVNAGNFTGPFAGNGINGGEISGMWFYGDSIGGTPNATDGLSLIFVNRYMLNGVYAWGVNGCGIRTQGAVTDTFMRPRVSVADAAFGGIQSHPTPTNGLCLGGLAGVPGGNEDTTSGSVIDAGMEGVRGVGIILQSADQITIQGGTSEQNPGGGILINSSASGVNSGTSNKFNLVLSMDLEANGPDFTGEDIQDNGQLNTYINVLATSPCSSPCTGTVNLVGGGSHYFLNGFPEFGVVGSGTNGISPTGFGVSSATGGSATLPGAPAGFMVEQFKGASIRIPYYNP